MPIDPADTEPQEPDHDKPGMMRRQLIAALNEPSADGASSKLRSILDKLISKADEGDLAAIREIFDRVDGKAPAAAAVADDGERKVTFEWLPSASSSTTGRDPSSPASTPAASASPAS